MNHGLKRGFTWNPDKTPTPSPTTTIINNFMNDSEAAATDRLLNNIVEWRALGGNGAELQLSGIGLPRVGSFGTGYMGGQQAADLSLTYGYGYARARTTSASGQVIILQPFGSNATNIKFRQERFASGFYQVLDFILPYINNSTTLDVGAFFGVCGDSSWSPTTEMATANANYAGLLIPSTGGNFKVSERQSSGSVVTLMDTGFRPTANNIGHRFIMDATDARRITYWILKMSDASQDYDTVVFNGSVPVPPTLLTTPVRPVFSYGTTGTGATYNSWSVNQFSGWYKF